jgi:hypothetical protein
MTTSYGRHAKSGRSHARSKPRRLSFFLRLAVLDTDTWRSVIHSRRDKIWAWEDELSQFANPEPLPEIPPMLHPRYQPYTPVWQRHPSCRSSVLPLLPDAPAGRPVTWLAMVRVRASVATLDWVISQTRPVPCKLVVDFRMWCLDNGLA